MGNGSYDKTYTRTETTQGYWIAAWAQIWVNKYDYHQGYYHVADSKSHSTTNKINYNNGKLTDKK